MNALSAPALAQLEALLQRHPALGPCAAALQAAAADIAASFRAGGRLYLAGNGGSAADCEHIAGELLKGFCRLRPLAPEALPGLEPALASRLQAALPAIPLTGFVAATTAFNNDVDPDLTFAQLLHGLARPGDVLLGLSTSGNAKNLQAAFKVARAKQVRTVLFTGRQGGALRSLADHALCAPADTTAEVQECHLPLYHALCRMLEDEFFAC